MVREIIDWCDKEFEQACNEDGVKGIARAFKSGFVEGALDGLTITGMTLIALGLLGAIAGPKK